MKFQKICILVNIIKHKIYEATIYNGVIGIEMQKIITPFRSAGILTLLKNFVQDKADMSKNKQCLTSKI